MTASTGDDAVVSPLGTLGDGVVGSAMSGGRLRLDRAGIEIDWWVGADDGWVGADAAAVTSARHDGEAHAYATMSTGVFPFHTIRPGVAPAIDTRVRVPGGELVLRAYAVAHQGVPLVVGEIENASPAAAVVAWVIRAAPGYRIGRVALDGTTLKIDERAVVELPRIPLRWAVDARSVGVRDVVVSGAAASGRFQPVTTRRGDLEIALLFPVAHRTRTRIAATTADRHRDASTVAVARLPELADVERGWATSLERGARVELPDEMMEVAVDAARVTLSLAAAGGVRRDRVVAAEAGAWGLTEGRVPKLNGAAGTDPWPRLKAERAASGSSARRAAEWLGALRQVMVRVTRDGVDVLPWFPDDWLGRPVALHALPTRSGPVSFALRWHGARPALLWDVPTGIRVRAPRLDPSFVGQGGTGEGLLAEIDPTRLLPLGTATASEPGVIVDDPGSFL